MYTPTVASNTGGRVSSPSSASTSPGGANFFGYTAANQQGKRVKYEPNSSHYSVDAVTSAAAVAASLSAGNSPTRLGASQGFQLPGVTSLAGSGTASYISTASPLGPSSGITHTTSAPTTPATDGLERYFAETAVLTTPTDSRPNYAHHSAGVHHYSDSVVSGSVSAGNSPIGSAGRTAVQQRLAHQGHQRSKSSGGLGLSGGSAEDGGEPQGFGAW